MVQIAVNMQIKLSFCCTEILHRKWQMGYFVYKITHLHVLFRSNTVVAIKGKATGTEHLHCAVPKCF